MTVKLDDGGDAPEGCVSVEAHFFPLGALRLELIQPNGEFVVYLALLDMPLDNAEAEFLMEASNAKSVNLWYQAHATGLTLVNDIESVTDLEECLAHYEVSRKASLQ